MNDMTRAYESLMGPFGPTDPTLGRQLALIETLVRKWDAINGQPLAKAVLTGSSQLGAGYQGTEHYQPQDRENLIIEEMSRQRETLLWLLQKQLRMRETRVLNPEIGIRSDAGTNLAQRAFFSEAGSPVTGQPTYEVDTQYRVKLMGRKVEASFLTEYIAQSFGLPNARKDALNLIETLVLPQVINVDLWMAQRLATRLGGTGSNYLGWDGIPQLILNNRATYPWTVIDMAGRKLTWQKTNEALFDMSRKGRRILLTDRAAERNGGRESLKNLLLIVDDDQWRMISEDERTRFMNVGKRRDEAGYAFNGFVNTDNGGLEVEKEHWLYEAFKIGQGVPAAENPSGCGIVAPLDVAIAAVACGAGGAPASEYFTTHGNNGTNFYYWVQFCGPSGESLGVAAAGPAFVAPATGEVVQITINNLGGIANVWSAKIWRGTSATATAARYMREYPIQSGVTTVVFDSDEFMPNTTFSLLAPVDAGVLQWIKLVGFNWIQMAMQELQYRDALWCAGVPCLNNRRQTILFINCGTN